MVGIYRDLYTSTTSRASKFQTILGVLNTYVLAGCLGALPEAVDVSNLLWSPDWMEGSMGVSEFYEGNFYCLSGALSAALCQA